METIEHSVPYRLGQLLARLEKAGVVSAQHRMYELASVQPSHMTRLISDATRLGQSNLLEPVLGRLPADSFSRTLTEIEQGDFSLGYYHEKAS